jgi:hypothetical protein
MKKAKKDNLFIMTVTEHKCMATLDNYAPVPEFDERIDASLAIMSVNPQKPQVRIETVTKTVSKTSIHHDLNQNSIKTGQNAGVRKKNGVVSGGRKALLQAAAEGDYFDIFNQKKRIFLIRLNSDLD